MISTSRSQTISAAAQEVYPQELAKLIKPLLRHAVRYWELTLMMVERTGVQTEWAATTRQDLERTRALLLDQQTYLEALLNSLDKMTMSASLAARVPFLDHKVVEFAMSLPRHMKLRNGETKYILKQALKGIIPDRVIQRQKKGFGTPINQYMLDRMGNFVEHTLLNSPLRKRGLFDYDFIARLLAEHRAERVNYSFFLWSLLNLSLWYEHWIDGQGSGARGQGPVVFSLTPDP